MTKVKVMSQTSNIHLPSSLLEITRIVIKNRKSCCIPDVTKIVFRVRCFQNIDKLVKWSENDRYLIFWHVNGRHYDKL